ncbi:MAG: 1-aminocyclopropane-1-carboxylate deaminase/D-cysteine desulfhydrase [Candidatus Hodarchaeales archaeon]
MLFNIEQVRKIPLCLLPTPIMRLDNLSSQFKSINIFMKRDDLTGLAFGGNKNRKLEYLLADARNKGAEVIITEGALQSNHALQTAVCCKKMGFECELVLSGKQPSQINGNYFLNQMMTTVYRVDTSEERKNKILERKRELEKVSKDVYLIPTGGSTVIGSYGYINCVKEISMQAKTMGIEFDYIIFATGSGGTQAGLILGTQMYYPKMHPIGISVGLSNLKDTIKDIINDFNQAWSTQIKITDNVDIYEDYFGEGYGIINDDVIKTIKLVAKSEGVFLDPVYTGKAMVGLLALLKDKVIPEGSNVLFLHTGGTSALFSYSKAFLLQQSQ